MFLQGILWFSGCLSVFVGFRRLQDNFCFFRGDRSSQGGQKKGMGVNLECVGSLNGFFREFFPDFLWVFGSTVFLKLVDISTEFLVFFGFFEYWYGSKDELRPLQNISNYL